MWSRARCFAQRWLPRPRSICEVFNHHEGMLVEPPGRARALREGGCHEAGMAPWLWVVSLFLVQQTSWKIMATRGQRKPTQKYATTLPGKNPLQKRRVV